MTHVNAETAAVVQEMDGFRGAYEEVDGQVIGFESYSMDLDAAPLFVGLPGDACQSPHWGYVLAGRLGFRHADGTEEIIEAGQAYYVGPGHTPILFDGAQVVEFSPADKLRETMAVVGENVARMNAVGSS